jgi:hypothetical protein
MPWKHGGFATRRRCDVNFLPQPHYAAGRVPSPDWIGRWRTEMSQFLPGIKYFNTTWLARKMICNILKETVIAHFKILPPDIDDNQRIIAHHTWSSRNRYHSNARLHVSAPKPISLQHKQGHVRVELICTPPPNRFV